MSCNGPSFIAPSLMIFKKWYFATRDEPSLWNSYYLAIKMRLLIHFDIFIDTIVTHYYYSNLVCPQVLKQFLPTHWTVSSFEYCFTFKIISIDQGIVQFSQTGYHSFQVPEGLSCIWVRFEVPFNDFDVMLVSCLFLDLTFWKLAASIVIYFSCYSSITSQTEYTVIALRAV